MILLTGATGKTGGAVARALAARGLPVRALVRNPREQRRGRGRRQLVVGDLADGAAVRAAVDGVEKALLLLPNGREQLELERQFVDLARAGGVRHVVKISSMEALPDAVSPIPRVHYASEQHIRGSGMDWTMIRPNFYMQNLLGSAATICSQGRIYLPLGKGGAVDRHREGGDRPRAANPGTQAKPTRSPAPSSDFAQAADHHKPSAAPSSTWTWIQPSTARCCAVRVERMAIDAVMELFAEIAADSRWSPTFRALLGRAHFTGEVRARSCAVFGGG
jgi:hypothetical protein